MQQQQQSQNNIAGTNKQVILKLWGGLAERVVDQCRKISSQISLSTVKHSAALRTPPRLCATQHVNLSCKLCVQPLVSQRTHRHRTSCSRTFCAARAQFCPAARFYAPRTKRARRRALSRCCAAPGAAEFAHLRQKVWPRGGEEEKKPGGERSLQSAERKDTHRPCLSFRDESLRSGAGFI